MINTAARPRKPPTVPPTITPVFKFELPPVLSTGSGGDDDVCIVVDISAVNL
jgi:hypothetical protein